MTRRLGEIVDQVLAFTAAETGVDLQKLTLNTTLARDLGLDGDDADEFLTNFAKQFQVDLSGFTFNLHFGPEAVSSLDIFLQSSSNQKSTLIPITLSDLIDSVAAGYWAKRY